MQDPSKDAGTTSDNQTDHRWLDVSRNIYADHLNVKGLEAQIGLARQSFFIYAVKELIDNALDEADHSKAPSVDVSIYVEKDRGIVRVFNSANFSSSISEIFDYTKRRSRKFYVIAPFRGAFGSALQYLACITHAYPRSIGKQPGSLAARTRNSEFSITNPHIDSDGILKVDIVEEKQDDIDRTGVGVTLPGNWNYDSAVSIANQFVLFNPHVNFMVNGRVYESTSSLTLMKESSAHYYDTEGFKELAEKYDDEPLYKFVSGFHGVRVRQLLKCFGKGARVRDVPSEQLHQELLGRSPSIRAENLGLLGEGPLTKRVEQIFGTIRKKKYVVKKGCVNKIPFVVEALTVAVDKPNKMKICFGINQSVPPNESSIIRRFNIKQEKKVISLDRILTNSGIHSDDPIVVIMHLYMPRMFYPSFAKASLEVPIEILGALFDALAESSRWYKTFSDAGGNMKTDWQEAIDEAVLYIKQLNLKWVKPTVRHVYYYLAFKLQMIRQNEYGYTQLDSKLVDARRSGLLPWDSLSDRSRYVDYTPPGGKTEKVIGDFLNELPSKVGFKPWDDMDTYIEVWLEKDSHFDIISPITRKYYVLLAPQRGYSGVGYIHDGVKRLKEMERRGKKTRIYTLGDRDPSGNNIHKILVQEMRQFGLKTEVVRLAITDAQIKEHDLPPAPAKESDPRYKKYSQEHGNKVYELDAMEPALLKEIVEWAILQHIDQEKWEKTMKRNEKERKRAKRMVDRVGKLLEGK